MFIKYFTCENFQMYQTSSEVSNIKYDIKHKIKYQTSNITYQI